MAEIDQDYLGDGVYVSFDGYYIVLDLRGQDNTTRIAMEPQVIKALDCFRKRIITTHTCSESDCQNETTEPHGLCDRCAAEVKAENES